MRRTPFFAVAALVALWMSCQAPAMALGVYTVSGVNVDVTVADAKSSRAAGLAQAETVAFARLVRRVTAPEDLAAKGAPNPTGPALEALVANVEVQQERPNGAHYVAQLTVGFDPVGVRQILAAQGLTVLDTRTAPVLVVARSVSAPAALAAVWQNVWANGGYGEDLAPIAIAPAGPGGAPDWSAIAGPAGAAGAASALYADLRVEAGEAYCDLTLVSAGGPARPLGALSAAMGPGSEARVLQMLADAANAKVQEDWKRSLAAGGGQRERLVASAFYASQGEWARLKRGLQGAAKTIVSNVSIDAVSKRAAMVSFAYVGGRDQLAAELRRNGVIMEDGASGVTLKLAPGGA